MHSRIIERDSGAPALCQRCRRSASFAQCEFIVGLVVLCVFKVFHLEAMLDEETVLS